MNVTDELLCKRPFTNEELSQLQDAVEDLYYFEFVIGEFECTVTVEPFVIITDVNMES